MIRLTALASVAVLSLAACNAPPEPAPATPETPAVTEQPAPPPAASSDTLTTEGLGPIRVGRTIAEVTAAWGAPERALTDENGCNVFHPARAPQGVLVMTEEGKVSRVSLTRDATVTTDKGLKLGATAAEVKAAYGAAAQSSPHKYQSAPAEYIAVWNGGPRTEPYVQDAAARGVVYEVGSDGKVTAIHGGGPSIQYVESCS